MQAGRSLPKPFRRRLLTGRAKKSGLCQPACQKIVHFVDKARRQTRRAPGSPVTLHKERRGLDHARFRIQPPHGLRQTFPAGCGHMPQQQTVRLRGSCLPHHMQQTGHELLPLRQSAPLLGQSSGLFFQQRQDVPFSRGGKTGAHLPERRARILEQRDHVELQELPDVIVAVAVLPLALGAQKAEPVVMEQRFLGGVTETGELPAGIASAHDSVHTAEGGAKGTAGAPAAGPDKSALGKGWGEGSRERLFSLRCEKGRALPRWQRPKGGP